jgi:hypothetical protein
MNKYTIDDILNLLDLPEFNKYIYSSIDWKDPNYYHYIENYHKYLSNIENLKNSRIYLEFIFKTEYTIEYISKLIYMKYLEACPIYEIDAYNTDDDKKYDEKRYLPYANTFYTIPLLDNKIKNIVSYYEKTDNDFAVYLKSIHSLLWIMKKYNDTVYDSKFTTCYEARFKKLLTDELKQKIINDIAESPNRDDYDNENNTEIEKLSYFILDNYTMSEEYKLLYNKTFYTQDWNFVDLGKIVDYIWENNEDTYTILNRLSADYNWAMHKIEPAQPGIQSSSIMVLGDLGYSFDNNKDRTPEVQQMVNEIYENKLDGFKEDFNKSLKTLTNLFKRTVEKQLTWGAKIF